MPDLVYAAYKRCLCGAGMAYDRKGESGQPGNGYWDCSAILLSEADTLVKHEAQLPFAFYEIKSESQPSAFGATTRNTSFASKLIERDDNGTVG